MTNLFRTQPSKPTCHPTTPACRQGFPVRLYIQAGDPGHVSRATSTTESGEISAALPDGPARCLRAFYFNFTRTRIGKATKLRA